MILQEAIKQRILVLDGAMGTMIQSYNLSEDDFRGDLMRDAACLQKGNNDLLCLTRPDVISDIHRRYLEAGADIITANTFSAQRISMADYHCQHLVKDINRAAVRLARSLTDEYTQRNPQWPRFVVATVGPTNKTASMSPDVNDPAARDITFDELVEAYTEQMEALLTEGIDALLIETIFDTLNAKAAIYAAEQTMERLGKEVPLMLSLTVSDKGGRTLSGQRLDAFLASVSHANIFSVGLNCSFGPKEIKPFLEELAVKAPYYITVHPNAGLPNALGTYDVTPEDMREQMREFVDRGLVNIIGGCCGTTDAFIAEYQKIIYENREQRTANREQRTANSNARYPKRPRQLPNFGTLELSNFGTLILSGLELLEATPEVNFINVGERCNVAGSRKFLRLISEHNYDEALAIARRQVEDGAMVLDINMDDGMLDTMAEMTTFLRLIASDPDIARVPLMIDSSRFDVIEQSLKCIQGKSIVNSISLKEGEEVFLQRAREVRRLGAAVIVMAFDEQGQATTYERKIEVCRRAYDLLVDKAGYNPADIIFDPNILSIATGIPEHDRYALDFIRATQWIRQNLKGSHVSGGVSNLSFAFRGNNYLREAMHAVFLYHAIQAGMDMGIVNPATSVIYDDIPDDLRTLLEDVILCRRPDAAERLIDYAQRSQESRDNNSAPKLGGVDCPPAGGGLSLATEEWECREGVCGKVPESNSRTLELSNSRTLTDRLVHALVKGDPSNLEADLAEAINEYPSAVSIIEGPLMQGMTTVGHLFADGRMFLPQVVKTARTMKRAVEILQPYIEQGREQSATAGTVLLATVKGDVHDIGKNIVSVVMACNNYKVIDLGVMVPAEQIVEAAIKYKPDIIGLSGLITPSLTEMCHTADALREAGVAAPLMIGGATTSALHTALKIAPLYGGPVIWVKDASQNSILAAQLLSPTSRGQYIASLRSEQQALVDEYNTAERPAMASLEQARANKPKLFEK
ncbi:MAG: homocysteine S-methyltransferase family protein [Bacteroidaceae bacterium]|nr:homocysteine S-methyltransferase family protein [Bacteroidaceae bacterium]